MGLIPLTVLWSIASAAPMVVFDGDRVVPTPASIAVQAHHDGTTVLTTQLQVEEGTGDVVAVAVVPGTVFDVLIPGREDVLLEVEQRTAPRRVTMRQLDPCDQAKICGIRFPSGLESKKWWPHPPPRWDLPSYRGVEVELLTRFGVEPSHLLSKEGRPPRTPFHRWMDSRAEAGDQVVAVHLPAALQTTDGDDTWLPPIRIFYRGDEDRLEWAPSTTDHTDEVLLVMRRDRHRRRVEGQRDVWVQGHQPIDAGMALEDVEDRYDTALADFGPDDFVTEHAWTYGAGTDMQAPLPPDELQLLTGDTSGLPLEWTWTRIRRRQNVSAPARTLTFETAPPIQEGTGRPRRDGTAAVSGSADRHRNAYQVRYLATQVWTGPIACESPRSRWENDLCTGSTAAVQPLSFP